MTIKTIITCDHCQKEIKSSRDLAFTLSSVIVEIKLEAHFCSMDCFKEYMTKQWSKTGLENE